ncbi:hypothetical protein [Sphingomonas sp. ID0503]|uniref:hypothetical protein n=1 Tax=Sphingomonas sp. ID0503 TaxID=3399691 RepID=UPI003AFB4660
MEKNKPVWDVIETHYDRGSQISAGQAAVIGAALRGVGSGARFLVFGCGNDSPMWQAMNADGETLFVENHAGWLDKVRRSHPDLWIEAIDYPGRTVSSSLPIDEAELARHPVPEVLRSREWDVILVDAPAGFKPDLPGRSLSIYWSSLIAGPRTHVFIDDAERPLEEAYTDRFFRLRSPWLLRVPRIRRLGKRDAEGLMLWSVSVPEITSANAGAPSTANDAAVLSAGRGAVIFLLDSNYLTALKTFAYTLRNAIEAGTHDIVVMTNDPALAEEPFVRMLADRVILIDDEQIERVKSVRRERVRSKHLHSELGKYTFLKLMAFNDFGYDHHIFMDVDMLCLDPCFRFNQLIQDADYAASIGVGPKRLQVAKMAGESGKVRRAKIAERFRELADRPHPLKLGINSGVWFGGRKVIGQEMVDRLVETGSREAYEYEQDITRRTLSDMPGLRFGRLPMWFNVTEYPLRKMGPNHFAKLRPEVRIVHYNQHVKPWQVERAEADWLTTLWWNAHDEAASWAQTLVEKGGTRRREAMAPE